MLWNKNNFFQLSLQKIHITQLNRQEEVNGQKHKNSSENVLVAFMLSLILNVFFSPHFPTPPILIYAELARIFRGEIDKNR